MPFKSQAQRRKFHAMAAKGEMPKSTVRRWEEHTDKSKSLPKRKLSKKAEMAILRKIDQAKTAREKACVVLRTAAFVGRDGRKQASLSLALIANELLSTNQPLSKLAQQHLGLPEKTAQEFARTVAKLIAVKEARIQAIRKQASLKRALRLTKRAEANINSTVSTMTGNVAPAALSQSPMMAIPGGGAGNKLADEQMLGSDGLHSPQQLEQMLGPGVSPAPQGLTPQQEQAMGMVGKALPYALAAYPAYRAMRGFSKAPKGFGLEGAARGGVRGAATTAGALAGGGAGLLGGIGLADKALNSGLDPTAAKALAIASLVGTPLAGAVGGGWAGNRLTAGGMEPLDEEKQAAGLLDDIVQQHVGQQSGEMMRNMHSILQKSHSNSMNQMGRQSGAVTGGTLGTLLGAIALPLAARRLGGGAAWKSLLKNKVFRTNPGALTDFARKLWPKSRPTYLGDGGSALVGGVGGGVAGASLGGGIGGLASSGQHEFEPNALPAAINRILQGANPVTGGPKSAPTTHMPTSGPNKP